MKTQFTAIALILASSLIAGTSFAGDGHGQVKPVRAQAVSSGDIVASGQANGEIGVKLNDLQPDLYPAKPVTVGQCKELHPNMHRAL